MPRLLFLILFLELAIACQADELTWPPRKDYASLANLDVNQWQSKAHLDQARVMMIGLLSDYTKDLRFCYLSHVMTINGDETAASFARQVRSVELKPARIIDWDDPICVILLNAKGAPVAALEVKNSYFKPVVVELDRHGWKENEGIYFGKPGSNHLWEKLGSWHEMYEDYFSQFPGSASIYQPTLSSTSDSQKRIARLVNK